MLVAMFNVVKVESVPLKSDKFLRRVWGFDTPDAPQASIRPTLAAVTARRTVLHRAIGNDLSVGWSARIGFLIACGIALVATTSAPARAATDEDEVRAVLNGMNGSYNRADFTGFASHLCTDMLKPTGFEAGWYASRNSDGPTRITINSVQVTGGPHPQAVANVRFQAANRPDAKTLDVEFLREGADWKACRYDAGKYL
jgi:hypothetical protein